MEQYISKSALVAEIERRKNLCEKIALDLRSQENKDYYQGKAEAYKETLDSLDTLEIKEVDLDKELENWLGERIGKWTGKECENMCRYFFELGLKAQKGE